MEKRKAEFIKYHMYGDGDCNGQTLKAYAEINALDMQQRFELAYFYSIAYCCVSAVFMFESREAIKRSPKTYSEWARNTLIFESDRKWVRQENRLDLMLKEYAAGKSWNAFSDAVVVDWLIDTSKALKYVQGWYYFSRYSAYLFIETVCDLTGIKVSKPQGLAYGGDRNTFVGGLLRYYRLDQTVQNLRRGSKLPVDDATIEQMVKQLQQDVKNANGDDNWFKLETSLCAYDKMFKGTRYNGYYADRMLQETVQLSKQPGLKGACEQIMAARSVAIKKAFRGEDNGWAGIRKQLKKYYKEHGEINWN